MDFVRNIPVDRNDSWYYIVQPLHRFDALWYEEVARTNYRGEPLTAKFFPLYPWAVKLLTLVSPATFPVAAFFLNTFLSALAFFLFYYFTLMENDGKIAVRLLAAYAIFPAAFFLLVPYAESLFISFVLACLIFAKKDRPFTATLFAIFATVTKPYGGVLLAPLAYIFWKSKKIKNKIPALLSLILIPLSFFLIAGFQDAMTGVSLVALRVNSAWKVTLPLPWDPLLSQAKILLVSPLNLPNDLDFVITAGAIAYLYVSCRKIRREDWIFLLVFFLVFYFFQYRGYILNGVSRYALIFFPIFMSMGRLRPARFWEIIYVFFSLVLLLIFFIYYTLGFFVA